MHSSQHSPALESPGQRECAGVPTVLSSAVQVSHQLGSLLMQIVRSVLWMCTRWFTFKWFGLAHSTNSYDGQESFLNMIWKDSLKSRKAGGTCDRWLLAVVLAHIVKVQQCTCLWCSARLMQELEGNVIGIDQQSGLSTRDDCDTDCVMYQERGHDS